MEKTYKREVASVMLVFLAVMWVWGIFDEIAFEAAKFLTVPVLGWSGAAFALDWKAKQT
ncbi:hypothetical protein [Shimia sp.]|uniref:hypothetical protein n=1 Tax=Shimia sp. TaxID=1954381 RepID=UPI003BA9741E